MLSTSTEHKDSFNHQLIQKILMYLIHRPIQAKKLIKDIKNSVLGQNLSTKELSWLQNIDERRWSIDHERPYRTIEGALFHCPVSALAFSSLFYKMKQNYTNTSDPLSFLVKFFQSDEFLYCIKEGQHIVDALLSWLSSNVIALSLPKELSKEQSIFLALSSLEMELIKARRKVAKIGLNIEQKRAMINPNQLLGLDQSVWLTEGYVGLSESFILLNQEAIKLSKAKGRSALLLSKIQLQDLPIELGSSCSIMIQKKINHIQSGKRFSQTEDQDCSIEALPEHLAEVLNFVRNTPTFFELEQFMLGYDLDQSDILELIQDWMKNDLICKISNIQ